MPLTYVCSPLSAPSRAEMLANAAKACTYAVKAEEEFGDRAVAPHAYLPYLLDDRIAEQRALALEFDMKLLTMCARVVVFDMTPVAWDPRSKGIDDLLLMIKKNRLNKKNMEEQYVD